MYRGFRQLGCFDPIYGNLVTRHADGFERQLGRSCREIPADSKIDNEREMMMPDGLNFELSDRPLAWYGDENCLVDNVPLTQRIGPLPDS